MALGGMEWVLVLLVVVVLFFGGAKMVPQFAKSLGRAKGEFEKGKMEIERELAAERAKSPRGEACAKCGTRLSDEDQKCISCGSFRERPAAPPAAVLAAR